MIFNKGKLLILFSFLMTSIIIGSEDTGNRWVLYSEQGKQKRYPLRIRHAIASSSVTGPVDYYSVLLFTQDGDCCGGMGFSEQVKSIFWQSEKVLKVTLMNNEVCYIDIVQPNTERRLIFSLYEKK